MEGFGETIRDQIDRVERRFGELKSQIVREIDEIKDSYIAKLESRKSKVATAFAAWTRFLKKKKKLSQARKADLNELGTEICVREISYDMGETPPQTFSVSSKVRRADLQRFLLEHENDYLSKITKSNLKAEIKVFGCEDSSASFEA